MNETPRFSADYGGCYYLRTAQEILYWQADENGELTDYPRAPDWTQPIAPAASTEPHIPEEGVVA